MAHNGNGQQPYGAIRAISDEKLSAQQPPGSSKWGRLHQELWLRLEQTPSDWLLVPFSDADEAKRAQASIQSYISRTGRPGAITTRLQACTAAQAAALGLDSTARAVLAVRRGKNWGDGHAR